MAKDPGFKFYPGDYLRDTQNLSEKSQVAYDRIMCEHMRNICNDMNKITVSKKQVDFFIKRLNDDERDEVFHVLTPVGNDYQIEWVALSISKSVNYSISRRENRLNKTSNDMKTYVNHMDNDNDNDNDNIILKGGLGEKIDFSKIENHQWFEMLVRLNGGKIDYEGVLILWEKFKESMIADEDLYRTKEQYKAHFRNLVNKKAAEMNGKSSLMKVDYSLIGK